MRSRMTQCRHRKASHRCGVRVFVVACAIFLLAPIAALAKALTRVGSFDVSLAGLSATVDPAEPVVPKNTESGVHIVVQRGDHQLTPVEATASLGGAFSVRATLSGPGLDRPITIPQLGPSDPPPDDPLLLRLPPLSLAGDYQLSNVCIV